MRITPLQITDGTPSVLVAGFFVAGLVAVLGFKFKWFRARLNFHTANDNAGAAAVLSPGVYRQTFDPEQFMRYDTMPHSPEINIPSPSQPISNPTTVFNTNGFGVTNPTLTPPAKTEVRPIPAARSPPPYNDYLPMPEKTATMPQVSHTTSSTISDDQESTKIDIIIPSARKYPPPQYESGGGAKNYLVEPSLTSNDLRYSSGNSKAKVDLWMSDNASAQLYASDDEEMDGTNLLFAEAKSNGTASVRFATPETTQYSSMAASIFLRESSSTVKPAQTHFIKQKTPPLPKTAAPPRSAMSRDLNFYSGDNVSLSSQTSA